MLIDVSEVTRMLIEDLRLLREGKITNTDGRVRAQLAREALRSAHLQLEGLKLIESKKPLNIEGDSSVDAG